MRVPDSQTCPWCQNVESWKASPEIAFKPGLCIDCGTCVETCPEHAVTAVGRRDADRCRFCFTCVERCPSGAMTRLGQRLSPEEIMEALRTTDEDYIRIMDGDVHVGVIWLIWGNGCDVISDYGGPDEVMMGLLQRAHDIAEQYS